MCDFDLNVSWNLFILWQPIPMSPSEREEYLWIMPHLQIILSTQKPFLIQHKQ